MLVVDDSMFRLAKMLETLLKVDVSNRSENLRKYKATVMEVDSKVFGDFLEEIKHISEHNHILESELQFLEKIVDYYNQLNELQLNFKRVCELYDDNDLSLSDLSQVNIDYINNRKNTISGYLVNLNNIEKNKIKIQTLNEQLIAEEKKKIFLDNRLLELEELLRINFLKAEGRLIVNGSLQYTSVLSEYNKLGIKVNELLEDDKLLDNMLSEYNIKRNEFFESVKACEICYNSLLTPESKQVLNELEREYLMVKYKLTMLKILNVLSKKSNGYDSFVKKREQLIDLIKFRLNCLDALGIKFSIDPFDRIKINEQLETALSFSNNSKIISKLMKEISELNSRTEEMIIKNNDYLCELNAIMPLLNSNVSFDDMVLDSFDEFDFENIIQNQEIAENQVIDIKDVTDIFNMYVVKQKTSSVIKRVNQMINKSIVKPKIKITEDFVPNLVIVPQKVEIEENIEEDLGQIIDFVESVDEEVNDISEVKLESDIDSFKEVVDINNINNDMFETIVPFEEPMLFMDRSDAEISNETVGNVDNSLTMEELSNIAKKEENVLELQYNVVEDNIEINHIDNEERLPDAFWIVQDDGVHEEESAIPSFDDQISKLLAVDSDDIKTRKRVA